MTEVSGATTLEVVALESELECLAAVQAADSAVPDALVRRLEERTEDAVGLKSIVAYRHGFAFDPVEPDRAEVLAALDRWYSAGPDRVTDPVLLRWLLWLGARRA